MIVNTKSTSRTRYGSIAVCHGDIKLANFLAHKLARTSAFTRVLKFDELDGLIAVMKQNEIQIVLIQANIRRYDFEEILKSVLSVSPLTKVIPIFAPQHPTSAMGEMAIWRSVEKNLDLVVEASYGFDENEDNEYAIALQRMRETELPDGPIRLSPREMEVLIGICLGKTGIQIGQELYIAPDTVKSHIKRLYRKLEVSSRAAAMRAAHRNGLLDLTKL